MIFLTSVIIDLSNTIELKNVDNRLGFKLILVLSLFLAFSCNRKFSFSSCPLINFFRVQDFYMER